MSIIYSKENDGTVNVAVFGKVSNPPEFKETQNCTKVRFSVAYGKKKYMNCEAWNDGLPGEVAACLEQGDVVMVCGTHKTWEYNGKKYSSLSVDFISPMFAPQGTNDYDNTIQEQPAAPAQHFSEINDSEEELPF